MKIVKSYILYRAKEFPKKVHNNILNSIKLQHKMDTILINFDNNQTSEPITQRFR